LTEVARQPEHHGAQSSLGRRGQEEIHHGAPTCCHDYPAQQQAEVISLTYAIGHPDDRKHGHQRADEGAAGHQLGAGAGEDRRQGAH